MPLPRAVQRSVTVPVGGDPTQGAVDVPLPLVLGVVRVFGEGPLKGLHCQVSEAVAGGVIGRGKKMVDALDSSS